MHLFEFLGTLSLK